MSYQLDKTRAVPLNMSTQYPDNANTPEWSTDEVIDGNLEVYEALPKGIRTPNRVISSLH